MDTSSLHFRWYYLLAAAIFVTHLSAVTSLPWKSPPKWKLPPLPDRRTSSDGNVAQEERGLRADLLSRVRHLEQVVQRRLDAIQLAKVRAMEDTIQQELADRGQGRAEAAQQEQQPKGTGVRQEETEGVLEKELLQHEEPHRDAADDVSSDVSRKAQASAANLQAPYNPMPKLKQISRDLVDLIEEIDRHTQ